MTKKIQNEVHHCSTSDGDKALHMTQRANGIWYYQRRVPAASQPFFETALIKKSLRTKDKRLARIAARQLASDHDVLFEKYETLAAEAKVKEDPANLKHQATLAERQAQLLKLKELADYASKHWVASHFLQHDNLGGLQSRTDDIAAISRECQRHIQLGKQLLDGQISDYDLALTPEWVIFEDKLKESEAELFSSFDSATKRKAYIAFVSGIRAWSPQLIRRIADPLSDVKLPVKPIDSPPVALVPIEPVATPEPAPKGELLSECIDAYLEDAALRGRTERTVDAYRAHTGLMIRILGDRPIDVYSREDARKFRDTLLKLPANLNTTKRYNGLSIEEIISIGAQPVSKKTVNNIIGNVSACITWCVREDKSVNRSFHFDGLKLSLDTEASEERSVWSRQDLSALFSMRFYHNEKPEHPHHYWLPLLGLFTGARLNELCQLYADDVQKVDDIWCISVKNDGEDQSTKTKNSKRLIPLHSRLLELGFIEFAHAATGKRIFPEIPLRKGSYSDAPSKWFRRDVRDKVLPNAKNEKKAFHSFRHNVVDDLKQQNQLEGHVSAIAGHAVKGETFGRYGKAYRVEVLKPVIEKLSFEVDVQPWSVVAG